MTTDLFAKKPYRFIQLMIGAAVYLRIGNQFVGTVIPVGLREGWSARTVDGQMFSGLTRREATETMLASLSTPASAKPSPSSAAAP